MRLEISKRSTSGKPQNIWKLNNTFLNNPRVKKEINREILKYFFSLKMKMTFETVRHISKAVLRKKFTSLNRLFIEERFQSMT